MTNNSVAEENQNAYEEAEQMICNGIEAHEDSEAIEEYLHAMAYMMLRLNEKKLKRMKP